MNAVGNPHGQYFSGIILRDKEEVLRQLLRAGISGEFWFQLGSTVRPVFRIRFNLKRLGEDKAKELSTSLKSFLKRKKGTEAQSREPQPGSGEKSSLYLALPDSVDLPRPAVDDLSHDKEEELKKLAQKAREVLELLPEWAQEEGLL